MYYDRRVPDALLDLLLPGQPLGWLVPWLHTAAGAEAGAHLQTRRDVATRRHGALQLYLGRTSPLEVQATARGTLRLHAHAVYQAMSPALFAQEHAPAALGELEEALRAHVEGAARHAHRSLIDGEAVAHAGLMRRLGPLAGADTPVLALDSEARVGFPSRAEQLRFEADLRARVGLPASEELPQKLDLVAIDRAGPLLLVEVKKDAAGLGRAAWQAAAHVARFTALLEEHPGWSQTVAMPAALARARVGLLGQATPPALELRPPLVPVLAAPDERADWLGAWRREIEPVAAVAGAWLGGLRLWRLGPSGELREERAA